MRWVPSLAVLAAVIAGHAWFLARDQRLPRDPGLYYKLLPDAWEALGAPLQHARDLLEILVSSSGWYNLVLALGMRALGRGGLVMGLADLTWVALVLLGVAWVAQRPGSARAATAAVLLAGAMPMIVVEGRTAWIHLPETALLVLALAVWQRDPGLARRRSVLALALTGAALITLRHSGLAWTASLVPLFLWTGGSPRRWGRIALVLGAWGLAAAVPALELQAYLTAKLGARERYASQLPDLLEQTVSTVSWPVLVPAVLGLALLVLRRPGWPRRPEKLVLGGWLLLGLLLWAAFRAGLDNFTPMGAAVALLAGLGLSRLGRWGQLPALLAFLAVTLPQWLPERAVARFADLPGFPDYLLGSHPNNHYRPWQGYGRREVEALLRAACPAPGAGSCVVLTDHGLFSPFTEDPGALELFLMGREDVRLIALRDNPKPPERGQVDLVVTYACQDRQRSWDARYPGAGEGMDRLLTLIDLKPVWTMSLYRGCSAVWAAPGGVLRDASALPERGERLDGTVLTPDGGPH